MGLKSTQPKHVKAFVGGVGHAWARNYIEGVEMGVAVDREGDEWQVSVKLVGPEMWSIQRAVTAESPGLAGQKLLQDTLRAYRDAEKGDAEEDPPEGLWRVCLPDGSEEVADVEPDDREPLARALNSLTLGVDPSGREVKAISDLPDDEQALLALIPGGTGRIERAMKAAGIKDG